MVLQAHASTRPWRLAFNQAMTFDHHVNVKSGARKNSEQLLTAVLFFHIFSYSSFQTLDFQLVE